MNISFGDKVTEFLSEVAQVKVSPRPSSLSPEPRRPDMNADNSPSPKKRTRKCAATPSPRKRSRFNDSPASPEAETPVIRLWKRGFRLYRDFGSLIQEYELALNTGFEQSWDVILTNVYIQVLKTVLRDIRDASSEQEAVQFLKLRSKLWVIFINMNFSTLLQQERVLLPEHQALFLSVMLENLREKRVLPDKIEIHIDELLFPIEVQVRELKRQYIANADLKVKAFLLDILRTEQAFQAFQQIYQQRGDTNALFESIDDFTITSIPYLDNMRYYEVHRFRGYGLSLPNKMFVVEKFRELVDDPLLEMVCTAITALHELSHTLIRRKTVSMIDYLTSQTPYNTPRDSMEPSQQLLIPKEDQELATNLDTVFPFKQFENVETLPSVEIGYDLETQLFGEKVESLNLRAAEFLSKMSNWGLDQQEFQRKFLEANFIRATTANPRVSLKRSADAEVVQLGLCHFAVVRGWVPKD